MRPAVTVNALFGWTLAIAAIVVGQLAYGWPGVALALSCIVFWLLLQFTRALRALRDAAGRPVGQVDSAVMLQARLQPGMRLPQILKITKSLGQPSEGASAGQNTSEETFTWQDAGGDSVQVRLQGGRLAAWSLRRAMAERAAEAAASSAASAAPAEAGGT